jgi:hypothetical protein
MKGSVVVLAAGVTPPATETVQGSTPTQEPVWLGIALLVLAAVVAGGLAIRRIRQAG